MSRYNSFNIFPYQWSSEDVETNQGLRSIIRIYGFNEKNESVYVCVEDFDIPIWVELPDNIEWSESRVRMVSEKLKTLNYKNKPSDIVYEMKHRLYFAHVKRLSVPNGNIKYERKKFPYLKVSFSNLKTSEIFMAILRKEIQIMGLGAIKLKCHYDRKITPEIRMAAIQRLPTAGWILGKGIKSSNTEKETTRKHEYVCSYKNLGSLPEQQAMKMPIVYPKVLSFDNEANSTIMSSMPKAERPNDKTFQIGVTILDPPRGDKPKTYTKYLFSMGPPFELDDTKVISCKTEAILYETFAEFIVEQDPDVIIGFNILGWDIPYMIDRCKRSFCNCIDKFSKFGCIEGVKAKETVISWSSSAYGKQEFTFLNAEGRLFIDMLPYIKKNYKLPNYRLETICEEFLKNTNKDPFKPKDIFKAFRDFTSESLSKCGKYCVQDSYVTILLYEKLNTWFDLTESATTNRVPIFDMIAQGQQQKMYSQVYEYCYHNNMVVETDAFRSADNEHYTGAFVSSPIKGLYKNIIPFDFCMSADTLVTLTDGRSKRIVDLKNGENVLAHKDGKLSSFKFINGLQKKGVKDTIKLWMEDGTTLTCTPDHKILTESGEWVKAEELKDKTVVSGIGYTPDVVYENDKNWEMKINDYTFNMDDKREQTLAFSRILGYVLADGSIYHGDKSNRVEASFGTLMDAENFRNDVIRFVDIVPKIGRLKAEENTARCTYRLNVPLKLANMIHAVEGVVVGKRTTQPMSLPTFLLEENCPLSIIKEFLGGLFGGDGTAPYLTKTCRFGAISFKWTTIEQYKDQMIEVFKSIQKLFNKFNLYSEIVSPIATDSDENPRRDIQMNLKVSEMTNFFNNIGFRYCVNKSCKLYVAHCYYTMVEKTRGEAIRHPDRTRKLSLQSKKFPTAKKFIEQIGAQSWFTSNDDKNYAVKHEDTTIPVLKKRVIDIRCDKQQEVFDIEVEDAHNFIANGIVVHNCSLYPSIIRAYNIDYSKLVTDPTIPDEDCHVMSWPSHVNCKCPLDPEPEKKATKNKDGTEKRVCTQYNYRWLKSNVSGKGVIPILLETVLDARKRTRKVIEVYEEEIKLLKKLLSGDKFLPDEKDIYDRILSVGDNISKIIDDCELEEIEEEDDIMYAHNFDPNKNYGKNSNYKTILKSRIEHLEMMNNVLDMRQKAFKVNANSMYGAMGVKQGKLPFLPGAMSVTFMGRENILKVNRFIKERKNGKVIYNDTDSAYCYFPEFDDKPIKELWKHVEDIVKEIKVLFPAPMSLEFEGKVYRKFLILTKKRYVALPVDIEGKGKKLFKRGIVLQRRDNCKLLREVYEELVMKVFHYHEELVTMKSQQLKEKLKQQASIDILNLISFSLDTLFHWKYGYRDFVITKQMTKLAGDYKNPDRLPSHVLLGLKMQKRGIPVVAGSRIEYLITKTKEYKKTDTQKDKLVDSDYFAEFRDIMRISYLDYLKQFINPIDEMLEVVLGVEDFVKNNFNQRIKYSKVIEQINNIGSPKLLFIDD